MNKPKHSVWFRGAAIIVVPTVLLVNAIGSYFGLNTGLEAPAAILLSVGNFLASCYSCVALFTLFRHGHIRYYRRRMIYWYLNVIPVFLLFPIMIFPHSKWVFPVRILYYILGSN